MVENRQSTILMAAVHGNVCLELARFLWFPPVILPPSCLEKSAAAATITCSQSLHPLGLGEGVEFLCSRLGPLGPLNLRSYSDCHEVLLRHFHELVPLHLFSREVPNPSKEQLRDRPCSLPSVLPVFSHHFVLCHLPIQVAK